MSRLFSLLWCGAFLSLGACTSTKITSIPIGESWQRNASNYPVSVLQYSEEISRPHQEVAALTAVIKKRTWPLKLYGPEEGTVALQKEALKFGADAIVIRSRGYHIKAPYALSKTELESEESEKPEYTVKAIAIKYE